MNLKTVLEELRFSMVDRPDPPLNFISAVELAIKLLPNEALDTQFEDQYMKDTDEPRNP